MKTILLGKNNELKNRFTHIRYTEEIDNTSVQNVKNFGTNYRFNEKESCNQVAGSRKSIESF